MRKGIYLMFLCLLIFSCTISKDDVSNLNGYWEIEKVVLENGEVKEFTINQTIDYFFLNDSLVGFRKKLTPQLDGSFIHNKDEESVKVVQDGKDWIIKYTTPYAEWEETILKISNDRLELLNQENRLYIYKRYTPNTLIP